jgi:ATP-dependent DNA helicase RecQ
MEQQARSESQKLFMSSADTIVIATNAFGMGINRPDIRLVLHYNLPGSVEAYYQEAGRAGRDGKAADCVLYFTPRDLHTQEFFISKIGENNPQASESDVQLLQRAARKKLELMVRYSDSHACRRKQIMEYFGQTKAITGCACDACGQAPRSAVKASYEPAHARKNRVQGIPTTTSAQGKVLAGKRSKPAVDKQERKHLPAELDEPSRARFERLRRVRLELAKKQGWPAYCILPENNLREVARLVPASLEQFAKIVGEKRAAKYGQAFLQALAAPAAISTSTHYSASTSRDRISFAAAPPRWREVRGKRNLADEVDDRQSKRLSIPANPSYVPVYVRKVEVKDK